MIRHNKKWTTGEKMTVRKLYAVGKTDKEIAESVGRKPKSVRLIRSKLGAVRCQKKPAYKQARIQASPQDIAALRTTQAVLKALGYEFTITKQ